MALIQCKFESVILKYQVELNVILPTFIKDKEDITLEEAYGEKRLLKTLYLLHGANDDGSCWVRQTGIERYATEKNLAVIMVSVGNSFYTNMHHGKDYYTFITEEIPMLVRKMFPLSDKREDNFIAGLSMGGYGACKICFRNPEKFAAIATMSGVLDIFSKIENLEEIGILAEDIFGNVSEIKDSEDDILYLLKQLKKSGKQIPRIYQCCGTEDFLYEANQTFKNLADEINVNITYEEGPGGHEWYFWDKYLKRIVDWLYSDYK